MTVAPLCAKCGEPKRGYKNARYAGGIQWQCRPCTQKRQHELHGIKPYQPASSYCDKHQEQKVERNESNGAVKWRCLSCEREKYAARMQDEGRKAKAQEYWREYTKANAELCREIKNRWKRKNPDIVRKDANQRRVAKINRTTVWADDDSIKTKYREAKWMTERTGILHVVDHFYPLQGEFVSGLHVPANLRVIPASVNTRKHNKMPTVERLPL